MKSFHFFFSDSITTTVVQVFILSCQLFLRLHPYNPFSSQQQNDRRFCHSPALNPTLNATAISIKPKLSNMIQPICPFLLCTSHLALISVTKTCV